MMDSRKLQFVLGGLFLAYLILDVSLPESLASLVDTAGGKIVIVVAALSLFAYTAPWLGVLGLLVAFKVIHKAAVRTGMAALEAYYPTEQKKWSPYTPTHQFPYTLEQEVVSNMTEHKFNQTYVKAPWRPVVDNTHDASVV